MDIRIGILNSPRELAFESSATTADITHALAAAQADGTPLALTDDKGRTFVVPVAGIAYLELGAEESRRVGFVA